MRQQTGEIPQWKKEAIPSVDGNVIGPSGIDIKDLAVASDGITIWAAPGATVPRTVFKSTDSGISWTAIHTNNHGSTGINADLVAIAPDNSNYIAICDTSALIVYFSSNGGSTWTSLGIPREKDVNPIVISDIAFSTTITGRVQYIAIAGQDSNNQGNVWYYNLGSATGTWKVTGPKDGSQNNSRNNARNITTDLAVAFSPNFAADLTMLIISADNTDNNIKLHVYSFNNATWDSAVYPNYPVELNTADKSFPEVPHASIALLPDYDGGDEFLRLAFVGIDTGGTNADGIYRIMNTDVTRIVRDIRIYSMAYDGATLIVGTTDAKIFRSRDPLSTTPTFLPSRSIKRPGGTENAVVDFAGTVVVTGTAGPMSAFAISIDYGTSFNDISLIDTALTVLEDVAVSSDGSVIYLVTHDMVNTSVWRHDSSWKRVLIIAGIPACLVRIAPDNPDMLYIVSTTTTAIYFSKDGGDTRWYIRATPAIAADFAVEDNSIAYIGTASGYVCKTSNSGFTWGLPITTKLKSINSLTLISAGNLLAGSTTGNVAYTTDGNSTWNLIPRAVGSTIDQINVTADGLALGNKIYAVGSITAGVYRWTIGQAATEPWLQIDAAVPGTGMVLKNGILYESSSVGVVRQSVLPTLALIPVFDNISTGTLAFATTPSALRLSATDFIRLWAIDTMTMMLYSFDDTLAAIEPVLPAKPVLSPEPELIVKKSRINLTEMKFFISYCDKDGLTFASSAAEILETNGSEAWYFDRNNTPGLGVIEDVTKHIRKWCNKIIFICTNGSINSDGQKKEILQWDKSGKQLIVIRIDEARVPETVDPYIYVRLRSISLKDEFSIFVRNRLEEIINKWEEPNPNVE